MTLPTTERIVTEQGVSDHPSAPAAARLRELEERLIGAGVVTDEAIDEVLTRFLGTASPTNGARMVARAWTDPGFRERLTDDGVAAAEELGYRVRDYRLRVVQNTPDRHNLIVCTLCSCYPLSLLGPSPGWYRSFAYRSRAVREPRAVLAEFGLRLPDEVEVTVWDASAELRYMVLPMRPTGTEELGEDELAGLVTRDGLIGAATV